MTFQPYDEVLEILRATHDGDDLSPHDLKLTELAVNGFLNERGEAAFKVLHDKVRSGYQKAEQHDHVAMRAEGRSA